MPKRSASLREADRQQERVAQQQLNLNDQLKQGVSHVRDGLSSIYSDPTKGTIADEEYSPY